MEGTIGEIRLFGGNYAPAGWTYCNGTLLSIKAYDELYTIIGTAYGGDGQTTFAVPDLRSSVVVGVGQGNGLPPVTLSETGGTNTVTLTTNQMPAHTHTIDGTVTPQSANDGTLTTDATGRYTGPGNFYATGQELVPMAPIATTSLAMGTTGGNQPVDITPPYVGLNYIICVFGNFPELNQ